MPLQDIWEPRNAKYLLSGLLKCGACGSGFAKINSERYGCAAARNKGESVYNNKITVICREYTKHMNEMIAAQHAEVKQHKSNMAKLAKEKQNIIEAVKHGTDPDLVKDELEALKAREADLEAKLEVSGHEPKPFIHPAMASRYHAEVNALTHTLKESQAGQATEHIRALIEKVAVAQGR